MKTIGKIIVCVGVLVALVDLWRIATLGHDWHAPPMFWAGFLILVGMYPERVVGIVERVAVERFRGKAPPEPPPGEGQ